MSGVLIPFLMPVYPGAFPTNPDANHDPEIDDHEVVDQRE